MNFFWKQILCDRYHISRVLNRLALIILVESFSFEEYRSWKMNFSVDLAWKVNFKTWIAWKRKRFTTWKYAETTQDTWKYFPTKFHFWVFSLENSVKTPTHPSLSMGGEKGLSDFFYQKIFYTVDTIFQGCWITWNYLFSPIHFHLKNIHYRKSENWAKYEYIIVYNLLVQSLKYFV